MTSDKVNHFIYVDNSSTEDIEVHVATLCCDETPVCLKFHTLKVASPRNELETFLNVKTSERDIPYFRHKMKIQDSVRFVPHKDDIVSILKSLPGTFGVWNSFQLQYFEPILKKVINITPLIDQGLNKCRFPGFAKTILDLYLEILPKYKWFLHYNAWRYFFAKSYHLCEIEFLAFHKDDDIYLATTHVGPTPCLQICNVQISGRNYPKIGVLVKSFTETRYMAPFKRRINIQTSCKYVKSKSEMKRFLHYNCTFGVWGNEQYDYFSKFCKDVVNVESLFLQELSKSEMDDNGKISKRHVVSELFLEMLRKRVRDTTMDQKQFREWIANEGWEALFKNPKYDSE